MTAQWCVAIAEHRRDEAAEFDLSDSGFSVHVPREWQREKTLRGRMKTTYELMTSPYLFVKFELSDKEQYALVLRQRSISHVLESKPEMPALIPGIVIKEHLDRERAERANLVQKKGAGRKDLVLLEQYAIVRHELWRGYEGKLIAIERNGIVHLDCNGKLLTLADCDIALVSGSKGKATA